jgi:hypothetical protein
MQGAITETYLSHKKIITEVYATNCRGLYRQATKYQCQRVLWNDVTKMFECMSARQNQTLENLVYVGT